MAFKVGHKVVYPNHGVSQIEDISSAKFDEDDRTFYHLRLLSNGSKVMVPEENLDLVGLRPLADQAEIKRLLGILEDGNIDTYKDWKGRYKQNLDKMKTGMLDEVAEVLKNLSLVSQKKSLSFREKKMYEKAKYFIVSEVAHVKEVDEEKAEGIVEASLQKSLDKLDKIAAEAEAAKLAAEEAKAAGESTDEDKDESKDGVAAEAKDEATDGVAAEAKDEAKDKSKDGAEVAVH